MEIEPIREWTWRMYLEHLINTIDIHKREKTKGRKMIINK